MLHKHGLRLIHDRNPGRRSRHSHRRRRQHPDIAGTRSPLMGKAVEYSQHIGQYTSQAIPQDIEVRLRVQLHTLSAYQVIHVTLRFGELHLVHTLASVPVQEGLTTEHRCNNALL